MYHKLRVKWMLIFILIFSVACSGNTGNESTINKKASSEDDSVELIVSAAASLTDAMKEVGDNYMKEHPEIKLKFNFGSSGTLMQQILEGAPSDLFFSAAEDKFVRLVDESKINQEDRVDLLSNSLALVVPKDKDVLGSFEELASGDFDKLAIGTPETVPAGKYAKQSLIEMNLWEKVEPKIIYTKDVRQVLQYVETGNVAAGIVYKTDAIISDKVEIIAQASPETHTPITYPVGVVKDTDHVEAAQKFYKYVQNKEALKVFEKYGFTVE